MEKNRESIEQSIVLKRNKYTQSTFLLSAILFIQRKNGSVHVFDHNDKQINLLYRSIKETRELIHEQNTEHHFYMNSHIIVSYHFIDFMVSKYTSLKQILKHFKIAGLRIGRNELINMISSFEQARLIT